MSKYSVCWNKFIVAPAFCFFLSAFSVSAAHAEGLSTPEEREKLYNNACRTCHTVKAGVHRLGPSLLGVIGRKAGSVSGFGYSTALANSDFVWDEKNLESFLKDPDTFAPGNNMKPFTAIKNPDHRSAIIQFLKEKNAK